MVAEHWRNLEARLPGNGDLRLLSLAPAYARWQVMFALDSAGDLYRSADGGQAWQRVLATGGVVAERSQIVYGPNEEQRPLFLLVSGVRYAGESRVTWGKLFRSTDGGQSWTAIQAGAGIVPTALAISPSFDQDGLIFVGTGDGRVLSLRGMETGGTATIIASNRQQGNEVVPRARLTGVHISRWGSHCEGP